MDKDIDEIFREKNREILINNLKYDLSKNIDNLLGTITNIFNLEYDTAIRNIVLILKDAGLNDSDKFVTNLINFYERIHNIKNLENIAQKICEHYNLGKLTNYNHIDEIIKNKKDMLLNSIDNLKFEEEDMNKYYDLVLSTTKKLKDVINSHFNEVFEESDVKLDMFIVDSVEKDKMSLANTRVTDYLKNRLYGKLETKIHMEIMIRDNN